MFAYVYIVYAVHGWSRYNTLFHDVVQHLYHFVLVLDNLTRGSAPKVPLPQTPSSVYILLTEP